MGAQTRGGSKSQVFQIGKLMIENDQRTDLCMKIKTYLAEHSWMNKGAGEGARRLSHSCR
jgi:hypothetical protein